MAAIAGVFLVTALPKLAAGTASVTAGGSSATLPESLRQAFDLTAEPIGLVYAAIFGLAPALLTTQLDKQASQLFKDLSTTEPASNASP